MEHQYTHLILEANLGPGVLASDEAASGYMMDEDVVNEPGGGKDTRSLRKGSKLQK